MLPRSTAQLLLAVRQYFVYILASKTRRIYTGVTSSLALRLKQHHDGKSNHTAKYNINRLVYFERFPTAHEAIAAEKRVKSANRVWRVALIESMNPKWDDLAKDWFEND